MAAERSLWHSNLRFAAAGAVVVATSLVALAPAWSGPVADADVIVDLSVIDDLSAGAARTVAPAPTSRLHADTLATMGIAARIPASASNQGSSVAGQPYGRLIADWPPRTAAELRDRSVTPVRPLTRKAAHMLAHVLPAPRTGGAPSSSVVATDTARLFPPPQILAAGSAHAALSHGRGGSEATPAEATLFPPPEPLPMAEAPQRGSNAHGWRPEPTAKPADGTQVAVLSPARPPAKPSEKVDLRPMPRPREQADARTRASVRADRRLQLVYAANGVEIPSPGRPQLESLAGEIKPDGSLRIQLAAYAGGKDSSSSTARRMSLSRALAVRSFLIDHGIAAGRIDVRALGNTSGTGEADRVDVVVLDQ